MCIAQPHRISSAYRHFALRRVIAHALSRTAAPRRTPLLLRIGSANIIRLHSRSGIDIRRINADDQLNRSSSAIRHGAYAQRHQHQWHQHRAAACCLAASSCTCCCVRRSLFLRHRRHLFLRPARACAPARARCAAGHCAHPSVVDRGFLISSYAAA